MQYSSYKNTGSVSSNNIRYSKKHQVFLLFFISFTCILLFACIQLQFEIYKYTAQNLSMFAGQQIKDAHINEKYATKFIKRQIQSIPERKSEHKQLPKNQQKQNPNLSKKWSKNPQTQQILRKITTKSQQNKQNKQLEKWDINQDKKQIKIQQKKNIPTIKQPYLNQEQIQIGIKFLSINNSSQKIQLIDQQRNYYQNKYHVQKFDQLPFCIVVPSYNNAPKNRYLNNINSILNQQYSNYHIVFIDDYSNDGMGDLIQQFINANQLAKMKIKLIHNQKRLMAMHNIYLAAKNHCLPYQIFLIVDGDDQLIGRQVLKLFNSIFQTYDTWLVYTNYLNRKNRITIEGGFSKSYPPHIVEANSFRNELLFISHLRAFYTKLLLLIKQEDLKDQRGRWFNSANDIAIYFPILQMCHKRIGYIPQITYLYNSNTGENNHLTKGREQKSNEAKVRNSKSYKILNQLFSEEQKNSLQQSIIKIKK